MAKPTPKKPVPTTTTMPPDVRAAAAALRGVRDEIAATFKGREIDAELLAATLIAGEGVIFYGPRGEAKTAMLTAFIRRVEGARLCERGLSRSSTLSDLLGGINVPLLTQTGRYERMIEGTFADCEVGFADEIFKASGETLNGLLTPLSERRFQGRALPLLAFYAASNEPCAELRGARQGRPLPLSPGEDSMLPFLDRFVYQRHVSVVEKGSGAWAEIVFDDCAARDAGARVTLEQVRLLQGWLRNVSWTDETRTAYTKIHVDLAMGVHGDRVEVSTRRCVKLRYMTQAHALLAGRASVKGADLKWLEHGLWTTPDQIEHARRAIVANLPSHGGEIADTLRVADERIAAWRGNTLGTQASPGAAGRHVLHIASNPITDQNVRKAATAILDHWLKAQVTSLTDLADNANDDDARSDARAALKTISAYAAEISGGIERRTY
jgi:MoxR-like ATPase